MSTNILTFSDSVWNKLQYSRSTVPARLLLVWWICGFVRLINWNMTSRYLRSSQTLWVCGASAQMRKLSGITLGHVTSCGDRVLLQFLVGSARCTVWKFRHEPNNSGMKLQAENGTWTAAPPVNGNPSSQPSGLTAVSLRDLKQARSGEKFLRCVGWRWAGHQQRAWRREVAGWAFLGAGPWTDPYLWTFSPLGR